jgi:hypothetical protein
VRRKFDEGMCGHVTCLSSSPLPFLACTHSLVPPLPRLRIPFLLCNILQCCTVALSLVSIPPPPLEYPARDAFGHCFERDERALEGVLP